MNPHAISEWMRGRAMASIACAALALPLVGCGHGSSNTSNGANLPPVNDYAGGAPARPMASAPPQRQGMSTRKKVVLLVGAAALYYMWKKHQSNAQSAAASGAQGQQTYYLSKDGRVYYRDQNGQPQYVSAPQGGIQVPQEELQQYQGIDQLQGYDNQAGGTTDLSRFAAQGG